MLKLTLNLIFSYESIRVTHVTSSFPFTIKHLLRAGLPSKKKSISSTSSLDRFGSIFLMYVYTYFLDWLLYFRKIILKDFRKLEMFNGLQQVCPEPVEVIVIFQ